MKYCMYILSGRDKCLPRCLKAYYQFVNYDCPVYIFYFDDLYSEKYQNRIKRRFPKKDIRFSSVKTQIPEHIDESELFYNRTYLPYVETQFKKNRINFLHMCAFLSNPLKYTNGLLEEYDYIGHFDDDLLWLKPVKVNCFEVLKQNNLLFGSMNLTQPVKYGEHQGRIDTTQHLAEFTINFLKQNNIVPKKQWLKTLMKLPTEEAERYLHAHMIGPNNNVYRTDMFRTDEYQLWINAVEEFGGALKYRWGDIETLIIFFDIFYNEDVYDFKFRQQKCHNPGGLKHIQGKVKTSIKNK